MTDRFSPIPIFRAQLKGLKERVYTEDRPSGVPDVIARLVLYVVPPVCGLAFFVFGGRLPNPTPITAAAGVMTGALFLAFGQMGGWRERIVKRGLEYELDDAHKTDSIDEAVAHVLVGMYASIVLTIAMLVGSQFLRADGSLPTAWSAVAVTLGTFLILLVLMVAPKLYIAYVLVNEVDDEMSGLSR